MTKAQIYEFVTSLTGGVAIESSLFNTFLDVAQMNCEDLRPWVVLRKEDLSQTASPADSFTTPKNLPTDFKEWYEDAPIQLIDANNNSLYLSEVPFSERYRYQKANGRFCVDYATNKLYLLGTITQNYTIKQSYIKVADLVSQSDDATWVFPERFHKILGLLVAIYWRKGIDYDVFNQTLADNQEQQVKVIYDMMSRWDANLQANMQRGKDPFNTMWIGSGSTSGGQISF